MSNIKKGFTLIEGIVVFAIITILAGVVMGSIGQAKKAEACGIFTECPSAPTPVQTVVKSVPVPQLSNSSERTNVAERAKRFDNPDKLSYVYLVSYGKVMAFYTAKGKVSSLNSYMVPTERADCGYAGGGDYGCTTVDAADIDGTYGQNVEGIFFFTTDGAYVEWKGEYMMSDQALKLSTQPELIRTIK